MKRERNKLFDVIVVGSGPAGAKTAYELSRKNHSVLVLEKEKLPRYKACGGGLPMKAVEQIGFDIGPVVEKEIKGVFVTFDSGDRIAIDDIGVGYMVMRENFDFFLLRRAEEKGTIVEDEVKVRSITEVEDTYVVHTGKGDYYGKVLVGADGANSVIAKNAGLRRKRKLGIAIEREVSVSADQLVSQGNYALFDFGAVPFGYAWIFPKKNHLSIGVYTAKEKPGNLEYCLERFIEGQDALKGCKTISNVWHPIPWGGKRERLVNKRILLVGDAAGLADPYFGEGISYALKSGAIASRMIGDLLIGESDSLESYSERIYKEITADFRYATLVHKLTYLNPRLAHKVLFSNPVISGYFAGVITGDINFRTLFLKSILTLPRWIRGYRSS